MATLEQLTAKTSVSGILIDQEVTIEKTTWHGDGCVEIIYKNSEGSIGSRLLYRDDEPTLSIITSGRPWSFDADGETFRLVAEADRIRLAHLFDPILAIHTSVVEPLPHQITAVYETMLPRLPLRFLLADDPGAGKTIMAGLLIKELIARGDLVRCLIVCPGSLVDQWQEELFQKFNLNFEILTNDKLETSYSGNWFNEKNLIISRLDKLSRDENLQTKIKAMEQEFDLVIVDEAHKMSASMYGKQVKYTKRYQLGMLLSGRTRNLLLLTATPHNGREKDFQLFLSLLDGDRFEGLYQKDNQSPDVSDMMRRMVKEKLLKFDGTPLFPKRFARSLDYHLSDGEATLYAQVTDYVREQFNLADKLTDNKKAGNIGFALTILQRRLASSPEAIYQSLRRRRERLLARLREAEVDQRTISLQNYPAYDLEDIDELEEYPPDELEPEMEEIVDQATAARTIEELKKEIQTLTFLEGQAQKVRLSGTDKKWTELSDLLQNIFIDQRSIPIVENEAKPSFGAGQAEIPALRNHQKLVIFTEHRDTLNYLHNQIRNFFGDSATVVIIHGGTSREERSRAQEAFRFDPNIKILLATDAAGEGINLQRAHLMVNYDLPWNPNRLEQRFGRIHRIGQTETCHLFNLVASETREGDVYQRLLNKLEAAREALGGQVFDVLGKLQFDGMSLKDLIIKAIRSEHTDQTIIDLLVKIDNSLDIKQVEKLLNDNALVQDVLDTSKVRAIRRDMERAEARRLQPFYIKTFFLRAFQNLGGNIHERENDRFQITQVPIAIVQYSQAAGFGSSILNKYERVVFHKDLINIQGKPMAAFICPGHPLLDATIGLTMQRSKDILKRGAILVDEKDLSTTPRFLAFIEHAIQDATPTISGKPHLVSQRVLYAEFDPTGGKAQSQSPPYLDYRPLRPEEPTVNMIMEHPSMHWLTRDLEKKALEYAAIDLIPLHLSEVKEQRLSLINKTEAAVKDRLTKQINYWDTRSAELREREAAGKSRGKISAIDAQRRADLLQTRLEKRMMELNQERQISPASPSIRGGAVILPLGLIYAMYPSLQAESGPKVDTQAIGDLARQIVMQKEVALGYQPIDRELDKVGYDIESFDPASDKIRFIEVKGRAGDATTVTVTRNEILTCLNKPDEYILAIVQFTDLADHRLYYINKPFEKEPDFGVTSSNYEIEKLIKKGWQP